MENKSENILTTVPIHLQKKAQTDPLSNHDLNRLMPKSTEKVAVLPVLNYGLSEKNDYNGTGLATANVQGLSKALKDKNTKEIMLPVGPEPFIGLYLSKLEDEIGNERYFLAIYDPCSKLDILPNFRAHITEFFVRCGINAKALTIQNTLISQNDRPPENYSGDSVIAESFCQMQGHGQVVNEPQQQALMAAYHKGKEKRQPNLLREQIIAASEKAGVAAVATSVKEKAGNAAVATPVKEKAGGVAVAAPVEAKGPVRKDDGYEAKKEANRNALAKVFQKELNDVSVKHIGNALEIFHLVVERGTEIGLDFKKKGIKENLVEEILKKEQIYKTWMILRMISYTNVLKNLKFP